MSDMDPRQLYIALLVEEARQARTVARHDAICDRIERLLGVEMLSDSFSRPPTTPNGRLPMRCRECGPDSPDFPDLAALSAHLTEVHVMAPTVAEDGERREDGDDA